MKKILITGSCSLVISSLIRKIIFEKQPYLIASLDRVSDNSVNPIYWNKSHSFHIADIRDKHILDFIFKLEQPDIVIHGAALTSVDDCNKNPKECFESNIIGTQNVIESCKKYNVKKIIYLSSDQVYGSLNRDDGSSFKEIDALNPQNNYSISKVTSELLIKNSGIDYNILRMSDNYGPRQTTEKLIPKTIKAIHNKTNIEVYNQGMEIRDWTHVFDTCSAISMIMEKNISNEVYNISANQEMPNIVVVQKICNLMEAGHNLISYVKTNRNYEYRYSTDSSKLRELGWSPKFKFKHGISETVNWYTSNSWSIK